MDQDQPEVPGGDVVGEPVEGESVDEATEAGEAAATKPRGRFSRFLRTPGGIILAVVVGLIVVLGIVIAIPATRYPVVGLVVTKDARVTIVDSSTHKAVSGVKVSAAGVSATTDAKGVAMLHGVPVGPQTLQITKQYYKTSPASMLVPIAFGSAKTTQRIVATGYPLQVHAVDHITGAVVAGAHIVFGKVTADTDSEGIAQIVLPISTAAQSGTVTKDGYNAQTLSVNVSQHPAGATAALTGTGTLRYLSKATGTINVMQANLDGTGATVLVQGTGNESDDTTTLLSTRDWKFSMLLANRGTRDALYLVSGAGQPTTVDAADASFTPTGWQGHTFFYLSELTVPAAGAAGHWLMRAYDADTGKSTTIDQSNGLGYTSNAFSTGHLIDGKLVYVRNWSGYGIPPGSMNNLVAVDTTTLVKQDVKSWVTDDFLDVQPAQSTDVYVLVSTSSGNSYFTYDGSSLTSVTLTDNRFYSPPITYLLSPSGKQTFWAEPRDGKNTIFIGDESGNNGKQIATLSDYTPYGWYGTDDRYLLLTKNDSELYIAPAGVPLTDTNLLKVTDYHKPPQGYPGYGGGYGG